MKIGRTIVLIALLSVAFAAISCQVFKPAAPVGAQLKSTPDVKSETSERDALHSFAKQNKQFSDLTIFIVVCLAIFLFIWITYTGNSPLNIFIKWLSNVPVD